MLSNILPERLSNVLDKIPYDSLCELRLRADSPVVVGILDKNYYVGEDRLLNCSDDALVLSKGVLENIIEKLTSNSLYSVNDQLIEGYLTYDGGIRVGVCGEVVSIDRTIKTIKNISSINFRFPHLVKNCSLKILPFIITPNGIKSTLIVSPPGMGKTTMLKDLIYQLSTKCELLNILVVDERGELSSSFNGKVVSKLKNCDIYSSCTKKFAFNNGIRSMKPDIIVTDEINIFKDLDGIENALTSGVKVMASIHANSIDDLKKKSGFKEILQKGLFERFVVLGGNVGSIEGVYNANLCALGV